MLHAQGLHRYADGRVLVDNVTVSLKGGDRVAIVGPTGGGKTLLLRSLALLDPLDAGEVRWQGIAVKGNAIPSYRSHVIYLHQRPALLEGSVEDNLRQPYELRIHRASRFNRDRVIERLSSLGRDEAFLAKQQRDLSGGESQLTALLRAIQLDPFVLLLDEPTAALDSESTAMVEALVAHWQGEMPTERGTVWVTHDFDQSRRVSSSVLQLRDGRLS